MRSSGEIRVRAPPAARDRLVFVVNAVLESNGVVVLRIVLNDDLARARTVALPLQASSVRQSRREQRDPVRGVFPVTTCSPASSTSPTALPPEQRPEYGALHGFGPGEPKARLCAHRMSSVTSLSSARQNGARSTKSGVERICSRSG